MLGWIILIAIQTAAAWFLGPILYGQFAVPGDFGLFLYAIIFAIIVFLTGVLGSHALKDVPTPSGTTLSATIVGALLAALIAKFALGYLPHISGNALSQRNIVLAGALLGYFMRSNK